jgi:hypothetical protein
MSGSIPTGAGQKKILTLVMTISAKRNLAEINTNTYLLGYLLTV